MKCGRCNKELGSANVHNSHYVINPKDPKTFGDIELDEFTLTKADGAKEVSCNLKDLKIKEVKNRSLISISINNKQLDVDKIKEDIKKESDPDKRSRLQVVCGDRFAELEDLKLKEKNIGIQIKTVVRKVPKTLIVCKGCKLKDDKVIW